MTRWQIDPAAPCPGPDGPAEDLLHLLAATGPDDWQQAGHGRARAGRPTTRVLEIGGHFYKLHEADLDHEAAIRAIRAQQAQERRLGVHPPDKRWFALPVRDARNRLCWWPGNRTPILAILDGNCLGMADLEQILARYFHCARAAGLALDLSLSNFGRDAAGRIHYVDDDLYPWQDHHPLHDFLAHLLRLGCLDGLEPGPLARCLQQGVEALPDLVSALAACHLPEQREAARNRLLAALGKTHVPAAPARPAARHAQRLGLLADIHGNLPALEAALAFLEEAGVSRILVLGDVVGYGPHPEECVRLLRSRTDLLAIRGNHDNAVVTGEISGGTTSLANWSWTWTRERLSDASRAWLSALPCWHAEDDWLAVHGAPVDAAYFNAYVYRMSYEDNLDNLQQRGIRLCFHGHTHLQQLYGRQRGSDGLWQEPAGNLAALEHALLSPGSVGQPRCGEPGVELAIVDLASGEYRFHRLAYDLERTVADMRRFDFPVALAERLQRGQ